MKPLLPLNLQYFASDRVIGSSASIAFYGLSGPVTFAECDSFKADRKSSQKQFQPLGQVGKRTQDIFEEWDLSFTGAVIDPSYDDIVYQIDQAAQTGNKNLRFRITETTTYYDGSQVTYVYPDTALFNFSKDIKSSADEITWSFSGASQSRTKG